MLAAPFIDNAKVVSKKITIPKDICNILCVTNGDTHGDCITFVVEDGSVRLFNSAVYAMQRFRSEMRGEAKHAGLTTEKDILELVKEVRSEGFQE